jgi:tellurite methyltransferase
VTAGDGGYDEGYRSCACFWGREPSRLVINLRDRLGTYGGLRALDAGCGEGKNAAYMAADGCSVLAVDISATAVANGRAAWPELACVDWRVANICDVDLEDAQFDVVVAYGLLHCLGSAEKVTDTIARLQRATRPGGYNAVCTFNDRAHDLRAHARFSPLLKPHTWYVSQYEDWHILSSSDEDLSEIHPHNGILHTHSMTRVLAQRPS